MTIAYVLCIKSGDHDDLWLCTWTSSVNWSGWSLVLDCIIGASLVFPCRYETRRGINWYIQQNCFNCYTVYWMKTLLSWLLQLMLTYSLMTRIIKDGGATEQLLGLIHLLYSWVWGSGNKARLDRSWHQSWWRLVSVHRLSEKLVMIGHGDIICPERPSYRTWYNWPRWLGCHEEVGPMSCEVGREERVLEDLERTDRSGEGEDG